MEYWKEGGEHSNALRMELKCLEDASKSMSKRPQGVQMPLKQPKNRSKIQGGVQTPTSSVRKINDVCKFPNSILIQNIMFLGCRKRLETFVIGY